MAWTLFALFFGEVGPNDYIPALFLTHRHERFLFFALADSGCPPGALIRTPLFARLFFLPGRCGKSPSFFPPLFVGTKMKSSPRLPQPARRKSRPSIQEAALFLERHLRLHQSLLPGARPFASGSPHLSNGFPQILTCVALGAYVGPYASCDACVRPLRPFVMFFFCVFFFCLDFVAH